MGCDWPGAEAHYSRTYLTIECSYLSDNHDINQVHIRKRLVQPPVDLCVHSVVTLGREGSPATAQIPNSFEDPSGVTPIFSYRLIRLALTGRNIAAVSPSAPRCEDVTQTVPPQRTGTPYAECQLAEWCMRPKFAAARSAMHGMTLIGMRFTRDQSSIETLHDN